VNAAVTFRRVHILGAAGAGKTALGRALAGHRRVPHVDTDDVYWLPTDPPFREKRELTERLALLRAQLAGHDEFVLTGSLSGWGDALIELLDGVVLLEAPPGVRLGRLEVRERQRYGTAIGPGGARHEAHRDLMRWAAAYDASTMPGRNRVRDNAWIAATGLPVLRLDGTRPLSDLVGELSRWMDGAFGTTLVEATDDDFAAMLGGDSVLPNGLSVPPGGLDEPVVLRHVRAIAAKLRDQGYPGGHWIIAAGGEAVGSIGFKDVPSADGRVEIGYGVAASRRRHGHATRAVALVLDAARRDPAIRTVVAETVTDNLPSQRALARNGFRHAGTRVDPEDGELAVWRIDLIS
jgi:RimJ/RimL family protein N-acetyltransferase/adenylate kinase family enzyme